MSAEQDRTDDLWADMTPDSLRERATAADPRPLRDMGAERGDEPMMTARVRYTLTVVIEGDDAPATDTCDQIENAIKAMGEGHDLTGTTDAYAVTVADAYDPALPAGATVTVDVIEKYL